MRHNALAETPHENGLTVRIDKGETNMSSTEYYGMIFSKAAYAWPQEGGASYQGITNPVKWDEANEFPMHDELPIKTH